MIDVCEKEITYLVIKFNASKFMVLKIDRARKKCVTMLSFMELTHSLYQLWYNLGAYVVSANGFKLSFVDSGSKFFRSMNSIFHKCKSFMCETVMMHLFNSHCKPILLYVV